MRLQQAYDPPRIDEQKLIAALVRVLSREQDGE
jgi:hypothetical protein